MPGPAKGLDFLPMESDLFCRYQPGEMVERPVVGPFGIGGKATSRQLSALEVILDALTADPRPGTSVVAAGAFPLVLFLFAFHQWASI